MSRARPRGPDPEDAQTFRPAVLPTLREATADLSWLLARGYSEVAATELVGNRFQLLTRQRQAIRRCALPPEVAAARAARRVLPEDLDGRVAIDGFNVLVTLERALGGGPVLVAADGAWRDLAGMHGTWRRASHTHEVVAAIGEVLRGFPVTWILDRPVSNSGRLAGLIREHAAGAGLDWEVRLEAYADAALKELDDATIATSDGGILDAVDAWIALEPAVCADREVWRVELG